VVSSIKSIANEETKREDEKDLSTRPFVVQFLDTFSPLWQLHQIKLPVSVTENGTSLATRLDELITDFTNDIAQFDNLADAYNRTQPPGQFYFRDSINLLPTQNIRTRR
jgi:hypothetical protein